MATAATELHDSGEASANGLYRRWWSALMHDRTAQAMEWISAFALICTAILTYSILAGQGNDAPPLNPFTTALLLVANLLPATAILVLAGRRMALRRAAKSSIGSEGRLHVRLVALFSLVAAIPTLFVVIFASILFQNGVQFWFSDPARGIVENAVSLSRGYYEERLKDVSDETVTMAGDLRSILRQTDLDNPLFRDAYIYQVLGRKFNQSAIVQIGDDGVQRTAAVVRPEEAGDAERKWISDEALRRMADGEPIVVTADADKIEAVTPIYAETRVYLYTSRESSFIGFRMGDRAQKVLNDYRALSERSRRLQLQFNAALFVVSLLIIGIAVWVALLVADRLVNPVTELVHAAQDVANGKLSTRVPTEGDRPDEVGILRRSFNQMTERLEAQTSDLLTVNSQLDSRRAFIETVLELVTAGIVSLDEQGGIRLANSNAQQILTGGDTPLVGRTLRDVAPAIAELVDTNQSRAVISFDGEPDPRTLAVYISPRGSNVVVTFEDITQQLVDQRRAAWADVARRIAHEIKNPLTPIQLAAERLKRRFSRQVVDDDGVFDQLTETIVRQVGDLRKIVDEFSSFARMPKPSFHEESLHDIVKQAMLLHEVAHPEIAFDLALPEQELTLVCDRRQLGQALTNIVKNAIEAIEEKVKIDDAFTKDMGKLGIAVKSEGDEYRIEVGDNGIGLPRERDRIVEPYMTTRESGTGLGLAIVKKIIEEHFGEIDFTDAAGGGTCVILRFTPSQLERMDDRMQGHDGTDKNLKKKGS